MLCYILRHKLARRGGHEKLMLRFTGAFRGAVGFGGHIRADAGCIFGFDNCTMIFIRIVVAVLLLLFRDTHYR